MAQLGKDVARILRSAGRVASASIRPSLPSLSVPSSPPRSDPKLYDQHVKLTPLDKLSFSVKASVDAIRDPYLRGDMVAALGEVTGDIALKKIYEQMKVHPSGSLILQEKPVLDSSAVDIEKLGLLAPDTLGGAYSRYYKMHGFEYGARAPVKYVDNVDHAYVMRRYRDVHDILHVLLGFPITVTGEIALKWFELVQMVLPMTALAAFVGPVRAESEMRPILFRYIEAGIESAQHAELFMNIRFEDIWEMKIVDVREKYKFKPVPQLLPSLDSAWNGNIEPLVEHYQQAIRALDKDDIERSRAFKQAVAYLQNL